MDAENISWCSTWDVALGAVHIRWVDELPRLALLCTVPFMFIAVASAAVTASTDSLCSRYMQTVHTAMRHMWQIAQITAVAAIHTLLARLAAVALVRTGHAMQHHWYRHFSACCNPCLQSLRYRHMVQSQPSKRTYAVMA
jgi:hypothetical protein